MSFTMLLTETPVLQSSGCEAASAAERWLICLAQKRN